MGIDKQQGKSVRPNNPCLNIPRTEKKCIEYFDSDERIFEDKDCGGGGSFMKCVSRQRLDNYQAEVLRLCEVRERTVCIKLAVQEDRIFEVTEKFRPDFWGRTTASVTLQSLIRKANDELDIVCRSLGCFIRLCGHLIVANTETTREEDVEKMVDRCASIIGRWESAHLARLKDVANALEMGARKPENLSSPKLAFDPTTGEEGSMDLLFDYMTKVQGKPS
jgi:hypothetical protein